MLRSPPNAGAETAHRETNAPLISFVVAVYDAEPFLPEFLDSVDALDWPADQLELIFVDDGSQDDSASLIAGWLSTTRFAGQLFRQPNGGPGAARNRGLRHARGCWISFPDSDDVLSPDYLRRVHAFIDGERAGTVAMVAARLVQFSDDVSAPIAPHRLDFKYAEPERVVDLTQSPRYVHLHTNVGFYRRELISSRDIRFDEQVRPVFEDAVFNVAYLTAAPRPTIAFLGAARYYYRKRVDGGSLTSSPWRNRDMFDRLPEKGYLALLERHGPSVPQWIQNTVYYDLQWHFKSELSARTERCALEPDALDHYLDVIRRVLARLDRSTLLEFHSVDIPVRIRLALVAAKGAGLPAQNAYVVKLDYAQQIMMISYFTDDPAVHDDLRVDGVRVTPTYAKTTSIRFFDRPWLYQRDLWVSSLRPVSLRVDGRVLPIVYAPPAGALFETSPREVWFRYAGAAVPSIGTAPSGETVAQLPSGVAELEHAADRAPRRAGRPSLVRSKQWLIDQTSRSGLQLGRRLVRAAGWSARLALGRVLPLIDDEDRKRAGFAGAVRRKARSPKVRRRFDQAWVLIDRDVMAQDNAEAFYRYLLAERPEVNAWFALSKRSPDWSRLAADGFRLIDFDSIDYAMALRNATYLISSQADDYISRPRGAYFGRRRWKFVFLQHGVIHNDLSRWLNGQPIRIMITTTEAEHRSIVGDKSPYLYSEKEVVRTGMPRHDRLIGLARRRPAGARRSILIAPTWRDYLLARQTGGHHRALAVDLDETPFFRNWHQLLAEPRLSALADREDLDLVFLAHPHLQAHLGAEMLPPSVRVVTSANSDIQELIVAARLMITDYSSLAFEAAYIETPVVYFQFDAEEFFSGRHTVRAGEFRHRRDGFGPVVTDAAGVVSAAADVLGHESAMTEEYHRRMRTAFTFRDGECSRRVYEAIRQREVPMPDSLVAAVAAESPNRARAELGRPTAVRAIRVGGA